MVNLFSAPPPRDFGPIPKDVVAPMLLRIKRAPDGDILTQSQSSSSRYLNCVFTFLDGPHKGAKAFARLTVEGASETAKSISNGLIGSAVRSALGVKSDDMSAEVEKQLVNFDLEKLDGLYFIGKTGRIERGKLLDPNDINGGRYNDKTTIACGVTPDMKEWSQCKGARRGFSDPDDSLDGTMGPGGDNPSNGGGNPGVEMEPPPWADEQGE